MLYICIVKFFSKLHGAYYKTIILIRGKFKHSLNSISNFSIINSLMKIYTY